MNIKKIAAIMALGVGLSLAASTATSADVEKWRFQDDDIDFLLDSELNQKKPDGTGNTIDVGDVFVAVFEMGTYTHQNVDAGGLPVNAIPTDSEVTGISIIQLVTKDRNGDGIEGDWGFDSYHEGFVDGVSAGVDKGIDPVLDSILGAGEAAARLNGEAGAGSILAMFINDATDMDPAVEDRNLILDAAAQPAQLNCASLADCVDEATKKSLLQIDGFLGDAEEFWTADAKIPGADDIDTVAALDEVIQVASVDFILSTFFNTVEPVLYRNVFGSTVGCTQGNAADGCFQVIGNGNVLGGQGLTNGAFAHSDVDANKLVAVPEPTSIMLLGVGLLGLGARSLRRKA